jgi:hypothetical protein
MVARKVGAALEVLDNFAVDEDAGGRLALGDPRSDQCDHGGAIIEIASQDAGSSK